MPDRDYWTKRDSERDLGLLYYGHNLFGPPPERPGFDTTELSFEAHPARFYDYVEWADDDNEWRVWQQHDPTYDVVMHGWPTTFQEDI